MKIDPAVEGKLLEILDLAKRAGPEVVAAKIARLLGREDVVQEMADKFVKRIQYSIVLTERTPARLAHERDKFIELA